MERIGVRELRQHASRYLARVRSGETIEVTDRGRPIARLVPIRERTWQESHSPEPHVRLEPEGEAVRRREEEQPAGLQHPGAAGDDPSHPHVGDHTARRVRRCQRD